MIAAVYRPRHDDVLLLDPDGHALCAIPRRQANDAADAIRAAATTADHAAALAAANHRSRP